MWRDLFRRRRRVDVGKYAAPAPVTPALPDDVAEEGIMIAASSVRMAVKNAIIIRALRDDASFDRDLAVADARAEIEAMSREKDDDADRLREVIHTARFRSGRAQHQTDYRSGDIEQLERRLDVSRRLGLRLRELADNQASLEELAEDARDAAWREISSSVQAKLLRKPELAVDTAEYERDRDKRLHDLIAVDLAKLAEDTSPEY